MIVIKLWGGLGNQLFQYAYGYQLAKKTGTTIILDTSWFDKQNLREPEILKLNLKYNGVENYAQKNYDIRLMNSKILNIAIRIPKYAHYELKKIDYLKESRFRYLQTLNDYNISNTYIDGYWQCPKYFDWVRDDLIQLYVPLGIRDEVISFGNKLSTINSTAVHVRHGDYKSTHRRWYSRLKIIGKDYYDEAIKLMKNKKMETHYFVFSDDIEGAKTELKNVIGNDLDSVSHYFSNLSGLEEWYLMSKCQNQIIGNSTFSWWAAYLNLNNNKIVIAPDKYMGNDDIIPCNWYKITV